VWRQKLPAQDAWLTAEVEMILREQYDRAAALLARHRSVLDAIAAALTVRLDMSGDEVRQIARTAGLDVAANDSRWLPGARIAG
jgi:ATP-dependent Zn protease